jgi:hypothetical protein
MAVAAPADRHACADPVVASRGRRGPLRAVGGRRSKPLPSADPFGVALPKSQFEEDPMNLSRSSSVATALTTLACTLGMTACASASGATTDADAAKAAWLKTATAMARGHGVVACRGLTPVVIRKLRSSSGVSCKAAIKLLAAPLTPADRRAVVGTTFTDVTVVGRHATITYKMNPGLRKLGFAGTSRLIQRSGKWYVGSRKPGG